MSQQTITKEEGEEFFKSEVLGHPSGLFVLFFTEMWERFSYYGLRTILIMFLTATIISGDPNGGWGWDNERAVGLYAFYTTSVYITPIFGGLIADKLIGYRKAVMLGAVIMTIGHILLALNLSNSSTAEYILYGGLACLAIGNGFFKPTMTSIVSGIYEHHGAKKDGAYSIFYMGVNAGSFLGMLLCGYIGETFGWHYGFGVAGIFMFFGMMQFAFTQKIFGKIGLKPNKQKAIEVKPTSKLDKIAIDRLIVVLIFCIFTVFFWAAFEQAGSTMTIFSRDNTQRVLEGPSAIAFKAVDTILSVVPLGIITFVLFKLFGQTFKKYTLGNIFLLLSFVIVWGFVIFKLYHTYSKANTEIPATWFGILNPLFIICLAPLFSKLWGKFPAIPATFKFSLGLILAGVGFGFLSLGAQGAIDGVKVSLIWLVLAYFFHTIGELCISPVGLSYISKLVPASWIALMFGVYYFFTAIGNNLAGQLGKHIDKITANYSLSGFFLILTVFPIAIGLIAACLHPIIKKKMHGVQ